MSFNLSIKNGSINKFLNTTDGYFDVIFIFQTTLENLSSDLHKVIIILQRIYITVWYSDKFYNYR